MITIEQDETGFSVVVNGTVAATGLTNAEAWRMADRLAGEPINRQEDVAEWIARKAASEGP